MVRTAINVNSTRLSPAAAASRAVAVRAAIEEVDNHKRLHSSPGDLPPAEFEAASRPRS